jgi:hypothetical protein
MRLQVRSSSAEIHFGLVMKEKRLPFIVEDCSAKGDSYFCKPF